MRRAERGTRVGKTCRPSDPGASRAMLPAKTAGAATTPGITAVHSEHFRIVEALASSAGPS